MLLKDRLLSPSFRRFLRYARPYAPLIVAAIVAGVFKFTLALSLPVALGYSLDHIFLADIPRDAQLQLLQGLALILTVLFVGRAFVTYLRSYLAALAAQRTIFDVRRDLFRHVQRLSMAYHAQRRSGQTTARLINDMNQAQGLLDRGLIAASMDLIFLAGVVTYLFIWDWRLALVSLFTIPFYGAVFRALNPRLRQAATSVQEEMEEMSGEVTEKISGLQVVMSFAREKTEEINFFQRHRRYLRQVLSRERLRMLLQSVAEFLTAFGPVLVIAYGGYRVITDPQTGAPNPLTIGQLIAFNGFLAHLYLPTRRLADYSAEIQERLAAMDRVFEVLDSEPDIADQPGARPLPRLQGRIAFEHVQFSYQPGVPVLRDIDFAVEPGEAVALVGRSGAGKTSLVNLVPRFYDPEQGRVVADGRDVRSVTVRSLRANIGMVLQDTILFSGTIRENILYGRHNATEREMIRAAEMAHVHQFALELPGGYDTVIGERGVKLSGGQKQRLSIARAFLRDPSILILDEATSNLDSGSELAIQEALRELMQGRTTLVIAHRLSTIVDCAKVVVLENGRIAEMGTHQELIRGAGPYRQFCEEQFGGVELERLSRRAG